MFAYKVCICYVILLTVYGIELNETTQNTSEIINATTRTTLKINETLNFTTIQPINIIRIEYNQTEKKSTNQKRKGNKCKRLINSKLLNCNQTEYKAYIECVRKNEEIKLKLQRNSKCTEYIDKLINSSNYLFNYSSNNENTTKAVLTRKRGLNLNEQQFIASQNSIKENNKISCCHIVYPRECIKTENKTKCFNRRRRTCGPHCVANVVYTQTKTNCEGSNCRKETTYISKRTTPRCTYLPQWPFIHCSHDDRPIITKDHSNSMCPYHPENSIPLIAPPYVPVLIPYFSLYQAFPWLNQPIYSPSTTQNHPEVCDQCSTKMSNPTNPCLNCKSCSSLCAQTDTNDTNESAKEQAIEILLERNSNSYF